MSKKKQAEDAPGAYLSSVRQLEDFISSVVWREIDKEIKEWLIQITDALVEGADHEELLRHQGRAHALKKVLLLPHVMLESARLEQETNEDR